MTFGTFPRPSSNTRSGPKSKRPGTTPTSRSPPTTAGTGASSRAPHSYPPSDLGVIFGPGYSGNLDWTDETVDLSPYIGQEIWLRFQYVTDDAIHGTGICLRELRITAGGQLVPGTWQPDGFVFTTNRIPQQFIVQVIQQTDAAQVDRMVLDSANTGEFIVPNPQALDRLVVVVAPLGFPTRQPASYTLSVEPAR